jgi:hypothetical protein
MSKHLLSLGTAAALAAVALFAASANAQSFPRAGDLEGGPGSRIAPPLVTAQAPAPPQQFRRGPGEVFNNGPDGYRDDRDRDRDDWRRGRDPIDFQRAQESCSRAGIKEAWDRGYYSAQYEGGPRIVDGRRGPEMRGRMRLHDRKGYSYTETVCELRRGGEAVDFDFVR